MIIFPILINFICIKDNEWCYDFIQKSLNCGNKDSNFVFSCTVWGVLKMYLILKNIDSINIKISI